MAVEQGRQDAIECQRLPQKELLPEVGRLFREYEVTITQAPEFIEALSKQEVYTGTVEFSRGESAYKVTFRGYEGVPAEGVMPKSGSREIDVIILPKGGLPKLGVELARTWDKDKGVDHAAITVIHTGSGMHNSEHSSRRAVNTAETVIANF